MAATERLYYTDSALLEFTATVLSIQPSETGDRIVLDRTAFYPTGGGQPHDTGSIDNADVVEVVEEENGTVCHLTRSVSGISAGATVHGRIDAERRLDHLQQHSGQHILSQAFVAACGAQTRSFHLGSATSTIDIELDSPTDDHMRLAEDIANRIIFEDRTMRVHIVDEAEASRLPLRKESVVRGRIRVIEIEDFDWSPCGGTHAHRTGQVGLVAIKSFERVRRLTRVEFVCGRRALVDYRRANTTAIGVARLFSAERDTAVELVARLMAENRSLKKRVKELLQLTVEGEAARLLDEAEPTREFKIVKAVFEGRDAEELRLLASKIVEAEPSVALLGSNDNGTARLVFARSAGLATDMSKLMGEACKIVGGRGGGKPNLAQGGGPQGEKVDDAIQIPGSCLF
jgi:alanyl-tRNA synthetase